MSMKSIIIIVSLMLSFATPCFAFQNEPDGFRGIKWGEAISERNDMAPKYAGADKTVSYTRKGDEAFLGDVMLSSLSYRYWDGKFSGVFMLYRDSDRFQKLLEICIERYGIGEKRTRYPELYIWEGRNTEVRLEYDSIRGDGYLAISSVKFLIEKRSFDKAKAKEAAEKGF